MTSNLWNKLKMKNLLFLALVSVLYNTCQLVNGENQIGPLSFDADCEFCMRVVHRHLPSWVEFLKNATIKPDETCTTFCSQISNLESALVCDLYCAQYELHNFIDFVKGSYDDPVYFCELASDCFVAPGGGAAYLVNATVSPKTGDESYRYVDMYFNVTSSLSPGEVHIFVKTPDGFPIHHKQWVSGQYAGPFYVAYGIMATKSPDCNPKVKPCETWKPGKYVVEFELCSCMCGSKTPNSEVYSKGQTTFTISDKIE